MAENAITEAASKKLGPLPAGVWVVVIAGGFAVAYFVNKRRPSTGGEPMVDTGGVPGVGVGGVQPGFIPVNPPTTPAEDKPRDNETWLTKAIGALLGKGYNPVTATLALRKWLAGNNITQSESLIVQEAIKLIGPPPLAPAGGGVIPDPTTPTPTPTPTPSPVEPLPPRTNPVPMPTPAPAPAPVPQVRYYTVKRGDNLFNIAKYYYGNGNQWPLIYNANRNKISNPNLIYPGQVFVIP